jgi:hypothetical protein
MGMQHSSTRDPHARATAQRTEHQPNLGGEREVGGQADDDAERQSGHDADGDRESDAHAGRVYVGQSAEAVMLCTGTDALA